MVMRNKLVWIIDNMEDRRMLLIAIHEVADKYPDYDTAKEASECLPWISAKLSETSLVVVSPVIECMLFGLELSNALGRKLSIIEALTEREGVAYADSNLFPKIDVMEVDGVNRPSDYKIFIEYVVKNHPGSVLVLESEVFDEFELNCSSRVRTIASVHEYCEQKEEENAEDELEKDIFQEFSIKAASRGLSSCLANVLREISGGKPERIAEVLVETKDKMIMIENKLRNRSKGMKSSRNINKPPENEVILIQNSLLSLQNRLESIKDVINGFERYRISECFTDFDENTLEITNFEYDLYGGRWIVKVLNNSEYNLENVNIYNVETKQRICEIKQIQGYSSIKKIIKLEYASYYGNHLIAAINGKTASVGYRITPFKISNNDAKANNQTIVIRVKNNSLKLWETLNIVTSNYNQPFPLDDSNIGYKETCEIQMPIKYIENAHIFLHNGSTILSNCLIFKL